MPVTTRECGRYGALIESALTGFRPLTDRFEQSSVLIEVPILTVDRSRRSLGGVCCEAASIGQAGCAR